MATVKILKPSCSFRRWTRHFRFGCDEPHLCSCVAGEPFDDVRNSGSPGFHSDSELVSAIGKNSGSSAVSSVRETVTSRYPGALLLFQPTDTSARSSNGHEISLSVQAVEPSPTPGSRVCNSPKKHIYTIVDS